MTETPTQEEVVEAARALGKPEFTRKDVAQQLGVEPSEMRPSWKAIKESGRVEQVRKDEDGRNYFRLAD
jgi:hypothetical protein